MPTGSWDWTARLWDVATGACIATLTCASGISGVAFSAAGTRLATICQDRSIWIWDLATYTARTVLKTTDYAAAAVFLPDDRYLVTSVTDGTARIWDTTADATAGPSAVTLIALPDAGYATVLPDGSCKLSGDSHGRPWWAEGLARFEPGELDDRHLGIRRLPPDTPILPAPPP